MKNKIFAVALVTLMLVGALVLASCGGCPGSGNCTIGDDYSSMLAWSTDKDKNCAYSVTDSDDVEKAVQCAPYKAVAGYTGGDFKGADCDC